MYRKEGYRMGGGRGGFRPIYRTPPFDKGKLLFPSWKYGVKSLGGLHSSAVCTQGKNDPAGQHTSITGQQDEADPAGQHISVDGQQFPDAPSGQHTSSTPQHPLSDVGPPSSGAASDRYGALS